MQKLMAALLTLSLLSGCYAARQDAPQTDTFVTQTNATEPSKPTQTPSPTPTPTPTPVPEYTLTVYGREFSNYSTELDLSGCEVPDNGAALERLIPEMPFLATVIMSDCGVADEEMAALNQRWESVRFIWTIYFGRYYHLRTDETSFIGSLFEGDQGKYTNLTNEEVMKLQYCTDMVALDLGHMSFTTCEFVKSMPNLRYLILADTKVTDISPLSGLDKLWYLEIFGAPVEDITPLLNCPNLRHLNISWCPISDHEPLYHMTDLERLWFMSPWLTWETYEDLPEQLPNTELQLGMTGSSVGGTWRTHDAYYEMRDAFNAFYISPP